MAARRSWAGSIVVYPGAPEIPVEATRTTKSAKTSSAIKDLCGHCNKPIDRSHRCPETMQPATAKVKGVARPDGSYAVVDAGELEAIKAQVESTAFEPLAYEDLGDCALETATDFYDLRTPKKTPGFKSYLRALYDVLVEDEKALIGRITLGSRQRIVAVFPRGDVVKMAALAYADERYLPDEFAHLESQAQTAPQMLTMMHELASGLPESFDISTTTDQSAALTEALAARILSGEPAPAGGSGFGCGGGSGFLRAHGAPKLSLQVGFCFCGGFGRKEAAKA